MASLLYITIDKPHYLGEIDRLNAKQGSLVNGERDKSNVRLQEDWSNGRGSNDGLGAYPAAKKDNGRSWGGSRMNSMSGNRAPKLTDISVDWGDIWSLGEDERARWKQELRAKLEKAKSERMKERDELKRQGELIRDSKKELQHYQREMLKELEEEIRELREEEAGLLKEKEDIKKEISKNVAATADNGLFSNLTTEPQFRK